MAAAEHVPESPMLGSAFPSPDIRQGEGSSSRSHRFPPAPHFFSDPSPATLLPLLKEADQAKSLNPAKGKGTDIRSALILRTALKWAVEHADIELISWLVGLHGEWGKILDEEVCAMEDDDGWGLVGMAVQSSCGRQEMEEGVRLIVGRWGLTVGPRTGCDRSGWTPLHLAALISTPPLISFLLNRGAIPHALTNRGLTPLDLVSGMPDRKDIAVFLEHSSASALVPSAPDHSHPRLSARRQAMLHRRRERAAEDLRRMEAEERRFRVDQEREQWVRELAAVVEVAPELLLAKPASNRRSSSDSDLGLIEEHREVEDDQKEESEDDGVYTANESDQYDAMLVFSLSHLTNIYDILITSYRPVCRPLARRTLPANALFLYARFAHYRCDEAWLEELIERAVERIEQGVYGNMEDLAYLAFWAYNTTVFLHLLRSDQSLNEACQKLGLIGMVEELINAIHVFVIRVAERRIDTILDNALLDHETLEDFDDVRFEGEWSLFRSFAGKRRRENIPHANQVFANGGSPVMKANLDLNASSPSSFLGSIRDSVATTGSPFKSVSNKPSAQELKVSHRRSGSFDSLAVSSGMAGSSPDADVGPRQITDILSGVLLVLQLYEVNPAIVVQAFSQIFFWIACELFNRVLTRKKYLCRSKAVQIRMNITVLEDWSRANGLPLKTATKHLEPITQLLRWLQCSSQIRDFDTLVGTMQTLKAINPLQMRRAAREYRFEVNEGRMSEECAQYLAQLQKDWEKRRVQVSVAAMQKHAKDGSEASISTESAADDSTPIDALFDGSTALADFVPQSAPECLGELLDSRFMLAFMLPTDKTYLVATPPTDAAFANANLSTPFMGDGLRASRPPSRASYTSSRPMGWALPKAKNLRQLPVDFFPWLKKKESERRRKRESRRLRKNLALALDPPLGPSQRVSIPQKSSADLRQPLSAVVEDEGITTPVRISSSYPSQSTSFPSPGLRTSESLDQLREKSRIAFESVKPTHERQESYELKARSSPTSPTSPTRLTPTSATSIDQPRSPHFELARHRRKKENGGSENPPVGYATGSKKWWKATRTNSSGSGTGQADLQGRIA